MEPQIPPSIKAVSDSRARRQSRTKEQLQSPSQPTVPPPSPPINLSRDTTHHPPAAAIAAASTLRSALRPNAPAEPSDPLRSVTPENVFDGRRLGASAFSVDSSAPPVPRDTQQGSPIGIPGSASRRQGMVFNDDFGDEGRDMSDSTAVPLSSQITSQQATQLQQQRSPSGGVRPRTRTLDAAMLMQRSAPAVVDQRHRVGSVSSSVSQPLLDEQRSPIPAVEVISHSSTANSRLQEPSTPSTPSKSKDKDKKPSKRLLKRQASRPSSPVPAPSPCVDSFPLPIHTSEPTKLIMLMKTLGGRMRGDIEYQTEDGDKSWHSGVAYIDDEKGCLMFNSGQDGPFFEALISDLRGCIVLPVEHPEDGKECLELLAICPAMEIYLRPTASEEWNLWLAAFLCWQQTRPAAVKAQNGGGNSSPAGIVGPGISSPNASADKSKAATIIKVGTIMLWDKGPTGSANDLVQRSSTRDCLSPSASWRVISSILQDNGELKLLVENEISSLCVIQLSQLSRCAIQQLDHTVLDEEFCLAIFPIYASTATHLSIFRPVYLALDNRVHFEVWFVLLRAFTVPDLYKLDANDRDSIQEVADLEEQKCNEEMFRIEKTIGVRVTEAKVKALPSGLDLQAHEKSSRAEQDPLVGSYVAEVILDGEVRARTTTKTATKTPYWREDCEFSDLPHTVQEVSIVLKRTDSSPDVTSPGSEGGGRIGTGQEQLYGTVHIALDKLQRGKDHEDWLQILDDRQQTIGSMLIKVYHAEQIALLSKEYEPLSEILHRFPSGLTTMISAWLPGQLRRLSEIFLNIFQASGNAGDWLMALVEDEIDGIGSQTSIKKFRFSSRLKSNESIESTSDRELLVRDMGKSLAGEANLLFRGNTLLTQSLEFHMRRLGVEYLETVLRDKIVEINEKNPDCEVDTSRLHHAGSADIDQRWNRLITYTTEVWDCIAESANSLPAELRHILKYIRAVAEDRYGDFLRSVAFTAVSGFLFLRFICPAILSPKLFGLLRDHPRPRAQRTLTLIAKVLQKMSNMSTFGKREEWMEPMNRFLTSQRPVFRLYIDQVCGIPAERGGVKSAPASYSTPITMLGRLGPTAKEGFPSLPYLIDDARSLASLVRLWMDAGPDDARKGHVDGELLIFNELCTGLQKRADACLAQVQRTRAAKAASQGIAEQLAESLEQATLIESLSVPYSLPSIANEGDRPPGSSGSDGETTISRRRSREWRPRGRDGLESRKASGLRQVSGMERTGNKSKNGKVGRTILNGIMRIGGRAESPDAKGQR
ncbi:GTPase activating factor [Conoideocrella luteorostrata]|uniref:GTPase activating factor n=1 Tax=Conoideocrella luteorostrata TaxID=1105319 RepID=A0AAJ0FSB2_9HYPO|nr:GTPase activating factor [Conoideocrella luteorostrata]